jgi:hypothetical protein
MQKFAPKKNPKTCYVTRQMGEGGEGGGGAYTAKSARLGELPILSGLVRCTGRISHRGPGSLAL